MFSSRLPADLAPNRIGQAVARLRAGGGELVDLTESNPTRVGLAAPESLVRGLAAIAPRVYDPCPLGLPSAREAVAAHLSRPGRALPPERVVLTAGTSEAYGHLFKLLCDPGDEVLTPRPSYPLFEHLTRLEGVRAAPYALEFHGRWEIDLDSLRRAVTPRTRAVLLVSPNNPTGSFAASAELDAVADLCRARELALIVDEVFAPYPLADSAPAPGLLDRPRDVLAFSLGGLSKSVGLPQLKLGWMAAAGPRPLVDGALAGLELICDTYLSVSAPVQLAAAELLAGGAAITKRIAERVRGNHAALQRLVAGYPAVRLLPVDGGWYAVLRIPATRSEEAVVLDLLERERVLVHPGYFFDFPREAYLVVSLLPEPRRFRAGAARMLGVCGAAPRPAGTRALEAGGQVSSR